MPFLILAFEHDAFSVTPETLFCDTIGQRESVEIPFKETVLDMPLFRSQDGVTAWSHASSYAALTRLACRAGYECKMNHIVLGVELQTFYLVSMKNTNWTMRSLFTGSAHNGRNRPHSWP